MARPEKLKLRAVEGRTVPLEDGSPWPVKQVKKGDEIVEIANDITVRSSLYWRRRVRDGDVIDIDAEATAKQAAADARKDEAAKKKDAK